MRAYIQIIKGTIEEYATYRLSFILWRVRLVIQLLVVYFMWWAIFSEHQTLFGYTQGAMLTYVLFSSFVRPFVMGTRTQEVAEYIRSGSLSNYLVRPMPFLGFCVSRDIADKLLNVIFAVFEIIILYLLLRPPLMIQTNIVMVFLAFVALVMGMILFFYFSLLLSFIGFWTPDVWAPRFLSFVFAEFFTGALFPLDILSGPLYLISKSLPFFYFIYFPLKVYLGELPPPAILQGFLVGLVWTVGLWGFARIVWMHGLRAYMAEGK